MLANKRQGAAVAVEQAVPALWLVRWVTHVAAVTVDEARVRVGRAGLAVPGPEVAAHDRSAAGPRCFDCAVDQAVVLVAERRRRRRVIALAVAREAELLEQQRLAEFGGQPLVSREIVAHLCAPPVPRPGQILARDPAPVERPDMRGEVIDGLVRPTYDLLAAVGALRAFVAERDQVVAVEQADQRGGLVDPLHVSLAVARDAGIASAWA